MIERILMTKTGNVWKIATFEHKDMSMLNSLIAMHVARNPGSAFFCYNPNMDELWRMHPTGRIIRVIDAMHQEELDDMLSAFRIANVYVKGVRNV